MLSGECVDRYSVDSVDSDEETHDVTTVITGDDAVINKEVIK